MSKDSPPLPDFIVGGPQKCATTWTYESLRNHPEIFMPDTDSVHYFSMRYDRRLDWYRDFFAEYDGEAVVGEESPSYIGDPWAPERIAEVIPETKLIFILRDPVDRAYSHYWHSKSKGDITYSFSEIFEDNYNVYQNWIHPGFYHYHATRFEEHLGPDNIKLVFFEDLAEDDLAFIQDIYSFLGVDDGYVPDTIDDTVNEARHTGFEAYRTMIGVASSVLPGTVQDALKPVHHRIGKRLFWNRSEYDEGVSHDVRRRLECVYREDIELLAEHVDRDLSHWLSELEE